MFTDFAADVHGRAGCKQSDSGLNPFDTDCSIDRDDVGSHLLIDTAVNRDVAWGSEDHD